MMVTKQLTVAIDFYSSGKKYAIAAVNILLNIFFAGSEQLQGK